MFSNSLKCNTRNTMTQQHEQKFTGAEVSIYAVIIINGAD
jgi:hypothetical protein